MKITLIVSLFLLLMLNSCKNSDSLDKKMFEKALENGVLANEGFRRCMNYAHAWLSYADPVTGLIPENLFRGKDIWNAHNAAADNFSFMVLTSYLLDKGMYHSVMLNMLHTEEKLTSRLGPLPDAYSFSKQGFVSGSVDTNQIIFGASEYIKDGLIPLTEYTGNTPWSERMMDMLDGLSRYVDVVQHQDGTFLDQARETEINGELLQTLSRVYWMTGDKKYLEWAIKIGDYYMSRDNQLLNIERLRLRDHGGEIIGGLSELYVILHHQLPQKKQTYQPKFYSMLDRILKIGRNADGMFYDEVNMNTGVVIDSTIVDSWGYVYNAYYTVYLLDDKTEYREAVLKPMHSLAQKYHDYNWESGSADGFADAIEGGINLYNRERNTQLREWLDNEIQIMWSLQDSSYQERGRSFEGTGIIEGWHGDGNFARTSMMYCLWKTAGLTIQPWKKDVIVGAEIRDNTLYIALKSKAPWEGTLHFGTERHKKTLNLPLDYPRINQFPEWYPVLDDKNYIVQSNKNNPEELSGETLNKGIEISLNGNEPYFTQVKEVK